MLPGILDSCKSLLFGIPKGNLSRLQHIQNSAARIILYQEHSRVTVLLCELHWLPVSSCFVQYKTLLLTFHAIKNGSPSYISNLVGPIHSYKCTTAFNRL
ncbi:hypothetical protein HOLleu_10639 [Holothuria leucospilota]|uniref:Uncharacterized protein n=1 Tax=Holothuria leucospilota TaxID=206669 RepID=A0A9Q1CEK9_HOLLE|nr:hypothetical protein HOLleu_10639 [Holothuria leucospilota]